MDVDTFFSRIRRELISLMNRELTSLNSARVQTTAWIRFIQDDDRVELAFQVKSSQFIFLRIVQHEIFTNYDVTYNNYRKYAMVVMNVQTQDRRHKV